MDASKAQKTQETQDESDSAHDASGDPDGVTPYLPDSRRAYDLDSVEDEVRSGMAAAVWIALAALLTLAVLILLIIILY